MKLKKINEEHYFVENNDGVITYSTKVAIEDYWNVIELPLSEVKELLGVVDVEKRARENYVEPLNKQGEKRAQLVGNGGLFGFNKFKKAFKKGYNQAIEDNKERKYTNEDMLTIRNQLVTMLPVGDVAAWDMIQAVSKYTKWFDEYIQSLQPNTEWEVEFINGKLTLI